MISIARLLFDSFSFFFAGSNTDRANNVCACVCIYVYRRARTRATRPTVKIFIRNSNAHANTRIKNTGKLFNKVYVCADMDEFNSRYASRERRYFLRDTSVCARVRASDVKMRG